MKNEIWFKRKTYGWGWTPANAKGWLVTIGYIVAVVSYPLLGEAGYVPFFPLLYSSISLVLTVGLVALCFLKGEKPSWRWGKDE